MCECCDFVERDFCSVCVLVDQDREIVLAAVVRETVTADLTVVVARVPSHAVRPQVGAHHRRHDPQALATNHAASLQALLSREIAVVPGALRHDRVPSAISAVDLAPTVASGLWPATVVSRRVSVAVATDLVARSRLLAADHEIERLAHAVPEIDRQAQRHIAGASHPEPVTTIAVPVHQDATKHRETPK